MRKQLLFRISIVLLVITPLSVFSQKTYVVKPDVVKATMQPTMWGIQLINLFIMHQDRSAYKLYK